MKEAQQYGCLGVPDTKIHIVPNGIEMSKYLRLPPQRSFKNKFHVTEEKRKILCLRRIHREKGIEFLIEAYAGIWKNSKCVDCILVLAGRNNGHLQTIKSLVDSQ